MHRSSFVTYRRDVFFRSRLAPIMAARITDNGDGEPHDHDFMEIQVVLGGKGKHVTMEGEVAVHRGDVFVLRPGIWHVYNACVRLRVYVCCFGLDLLGRELAWLRSDPPLNHLLWRGPLGLDTKGIMAVHLGATGLRDASRHLDALVRMTEETREENRAGQIGRLLLLFGVLARHIGAEHRAAVDLETRTHPRAVEAVHLLESDVAFGWSLAALAERVHLEPSYLSRIVKRHMGVAPMTYLARVRAERAALLLIRSDKSVSDVGAAVGWADPVYFARRFKRHFGLTATEYRRRFRQPPMI